jgi:acetyltransferase-like isoleucine patch superfamily enzyme
MLGSNTPAKGRNIRIGRNVCFGQGVILHDSVTIESNTVIGPYVVIGEPSADSYKSSNYSNPETVIGKDSVIRSGTIIYAGCRFGQGTTTGHHAVIRERTVCGTECNFGTFSTSDGDVRIGDRCRFHYYTFVCKNSTIGDDVWMFPRSMLLEDKHPPCGLCARGPTIRDRAVIGSAALIMPGLTIGEDSVIAAASTVTRDVPAGMLVVGHPGKLAGKAARLRCELGLVDETYPWTKHYRRSG